MLHLVLVWSLVAVNHTLTLCIAARMTLTLYHASIMSCHGKTVSHSNSMLEVMSNISALSTTAHMAPPYYVPICYIRHDTFTLSDHAWNCGPAKCLAPHCLATCLAPRCLATSLAPSLCFTRVNHRYMNHTICGTFLVCQIMYDTFKRCHIIWHQVHDTFTLYVTSWITPLHTKCHIMYDSLILHSMYHSQNIIRVYMTP